MDKIIDRHEMQLADIQENIATFYFEKPAEVVGVYDYAFRVFPKNALLAHRQDFSLMKWL